MKPLTVRQVADRLGVHYDTARDYIKSGRLKARRFGLRTLKVTEVDLEAFLTASIIGPEPGPEPNRQRPELARIDLGQRARRRTAETRTSSDKHAWRKGYRRG